MPDVAVSPEIVRNLLIVAVLFLITIPMLVGLLIVRLGRIAEALERIANGSDKKSGDTKD